MANEGLIKFDWPDTGILTFTANILKPDSSIRQAAIAFSDTGHLGRYKNTTSIPIIIAGDSIKIYRAGVWVDTEPYRPEVDATATLKAMTGITEGGTWTWEKTEKIRNAFMAGNWRVKPTDATKQELMDAEEETEVILEQTITRRPGSGETYREITVKI